MLNKHETIADIEAVLREKGFRVTKGRVELLTFLQHSGQPLSIQKILTSWKGKAPDTVTLYRSLTDLTTAGVVRRIDLNTGVAHFEYTPDRPHHHHIVCNDCGVIEEIKECSIEHLEEKILQTSKRFTHITTHNLEFFGHCKRCATI